MGNNFQLAFSKVISFYHKIMGYLVLWSCIKSFDHIVPKGGIFQNSNFSGDGS